MSGAGGSLSPGAAYGSGSRSDVYLRERRAALAAHPVRLGLDYIEVRQDEIPASGALPARPVRLVLHFVPPPAGSTPAADRYALLDDLAAALDTVAAGSGNAEETPLRFLASSSDGGTDGGEGTAVDPLFRIVDAEHPAGEARLELSLSYNGDSALARRLGPAPAFDLELVGVPDVDPFFARAGFSLDTAAPRSADCAEGECEAPGPAPSPRWISYLARDFDSFRRLMLDHLARRLPGRVDENPADGLTTLVETLAGELDLAAYHQDSVATEAYLGTARLRTSVARHGTLVGYELGEGTNARVWSTFRLAAGVDPDAGVALAPGAGTLTSDPASGATLVRGTGASFLAELKAGDVILAHPALGPEPAEIDSADPSSPRFRPAPQRRTVTAVESDTALRVDAPFDPPLSGAPFLRSGTELLSRLPRLTSGGAPVGRVAPGSREHELALRDEPVVYETAEPAVLRPEHDELPLYAWGAPSYRLPAGALGAALVGRYPHLAPGDVLILEEVLPAVPGGSVEPRHRRAVRLTVVRGGDDPLADVAALPAAAFPAGGPSGTLASTGTTVTGAGTAFAAELRVGDALVVDGGAGPGPGGRGELRRVTAVVSDTELTVDAPFRSDLAPGTAYRLGRLTEVEWAEEDAPSFPLVVARLDADGNRVDGVTVARGNTVLADHGRTVGRPGALASGTATSAGTVVTGSGTAFLAEVEPGREVTAAGQVRRVESVTSDTELAVFEPFDPPLAAGTRLFLGAPPEAWVVPAAEPEGFVAGPRSPFGPVLARPGLTHRSLLDAAGNRLLPAARALLQEAPAALPALDLRDGRGPWTLRPDLLGSDRLARDYVVEMEEDGAARLRFGDGELGRPPAPGTTLVPVYRVGSGAAGRMGAGSLAHAVTAAAGVEGVTNLLPTVGGEEPESLEEARRAIPGSLLSRPAPGRVEGFARRAEEYPCVARAAADLAWTGSWHRLRLAVERTGGRPLDDDFRRGLAAYLSAYLPAGWELEIEDVRWVGLDLAFTVRLAPGAVPALVEQSLEAALGSAPGGYFDPAGIDFGRPVYLSGLVERALAVPGVAAVDLGTDGGTGGGTTGAAGGDADAASAGGSDGTTRFRRAGEPSRGELTAGRIRLGDLELPRLDNDPARPENGTLRLHLREAR